MAGLSINYGCNAGRLRLYSPRAPFVKALTVHSDYRREDAGEHEPRKAHLRGSPPKTSWRALFLSFTELRVIAISS
jgi:hypothetical protein